MVTNWSWGWQGGVQCREGRASRLARLWVPIVSPLPFKERNRERLCVN